MTRWATASPSTSIRSSSDGRLGSDTVSDLSEQLASFIRHAVDARMVRVEEMRRLTGGASRETWSFDATIEHGDGRTETLPLVLQRDTRGAPKQMSRALEFRLLQAAHERGVPTPEPFLLGDASLGGVQTDGPPAEFFVVQRLDGETLPGRLLRDERYADARRALPAQLGRALAQIHAMPIDAPGLDALQRPPDGVPAAAWSLERHEQIYRAIALEPHPAFELAFRWLKERADLTPRPPLPRVERGSSAGGRTRTRATRVFPAGRPRGERGSGDGGGDGGRARTGEDAAASVGANTPWGSGAGGRARTGEEGGGRNDRVLVHGDFRMGNVLFDAGGMRAVLDWELAHIGDPAEDLAWVMVRSWRFGGGQPVGGIGTREEFFAAYEAAGGAPVDPAWVRFWEVFGNLRWGIICLSQARTYLDGHSTSVELASIGRRTAETEWELLSLMDAPGARSTGPGGGDA